MTDLRPDLTIVHDPPPIPLRRHDWRIIDDEGRLIASGATRDECMQDYEQETTP